MSGCCTDIARFSTWPSNVLLIIQGTTCYKEWSMVFSFLSVITMRYGALIIYVPLLKHVSIKFYYLGNNIMTHLASSLCKIIHLYCDDGFRSLLLYSHLFDTYLNYHLISGKSNYVRELWIYGLTRQSHARLQCFHL